MADLGFLNVVTMRASAVLTSSRPVALLLLLLCSTSGCATTAKTFRVLDAETRKPIEGAVALAEWIDVEGVPGLSYTNTAKIVEAVTDKNGFFQIPAIIGTLAIQDPHIKVYKPGYVGWDSRWIYLGCYPDERTLARVIRREDFSMRDQDILLEPWKKEYSFISHGSFMRTTARFEDVGMTESKYLEVIRYEIPFYTKERAVLRKKRK